MFFKKQKSTQESPPPLPKPKPRQFQVNETVDIHIQNYKVVGTNNKILYEGCLCESIQEYSYGTLTSRSIFDLTNLRMLVTSSLTSSQTFISFPVSFAANADSCTVVRLSDIERVEFEEAEKVYEDETVYWIDEE